MKFWLIVCYAFFIPYILGINETLSNLDSKNSTEVVAEKVQKTTPTVTNTLNTEGGKIIQNTPSLEDLITVHKELGNRSHSTIVARKEAKLTDTDDYHPKFNTVDQSNDKIKNKTIGKDSGLRNSTGAIVLNFDTKNGSVTSPGPSLLTKIVKPTKPLVLSYELLANSGVKYERKAESHESLSANFPMTKINSASQQPGMIMPIVIAILVVPMFAVLGYMALRRGQEAWKNRHYKRMDFLLDGMYNE